MRRKDVWAEKAIDFIPMTENRESALVDAYMKGFEDARREIAEAMRISGECLETDKCMARGFFETLRHKVLKLGNEDI